jgi:hypothetical protein
MPRSFRSFHTPTAPLGLLSLSQRFRSPHDEKSPRETLNKPTTFLPKSKMKKRLSSKLDALERQAGTDGELSPAGKTLLVEILARRDALAWPWRFTLTYQPPHCELRTLWKEYQSGVVGIAAKSSGRTNWKTAHELRQSLIASGHLTAVHGGGQITSMFLTATGEAVARGCVGDYLANFHDEGVEALDRLRRLVVLTECSAVAETVLWGRRCVGDPSEWNYLTDRILPCITAGAVRVEPDTVGRIVFIPIDGVPEPEKIDVNVEPDPQFLQVYLKSWSDERSVLERCEPRDPSECFVPNPANYPFNYRDVSAGETNEE